uniref:Uncharacterized protein n=1 Tax=Chaetoceros debilis TaxID=122233 RepID=A0A7S3PV10_9STRA
MDRNPSHGGAPLMTAPDDALSPNRNTHTISKRRHRGWEMESLDEGACISFSHPPVTPDRQARRNKKEHPFQFTLGASTNSLAFISQSSDSEMDDDDHEINTNNAHFMPMQFQFGSFNYQEQRKRSRTDVGYNGTFPNTACNKNTIEWWKKQTSQQSSSRASCSMSSFTSGPNTCNSTISRNANTTVSKCHVCQIEQQPLTTLPMSQKNVTTNTNINHTVMSVLPSSSMSTPSSFYQHKPQHHSTRKPKNSLLSYFNPTKSSARTSSCTRDASSSLNPHPSAEVPQVIAQAPSMPSCSYCDRSTCTSCMRICEACTGQYCTFCSMIDYEGPVERIFCFNCCNTNGSTDKDAMDMS